MADLSNPTVQALLKHAEDCREALAKRWFLPNWRKSSLAGLDLSGVDLHDAKLHYAKFEHSNLEGANLSGARLVGASFETANLRDANLNRADLRSADLYGTELNRANLNEANLESVNYLGLAKVVGARFTKGVVLAASKYNEKLILISEDKITSITREKLRETNHG